MCFCTALGTKEENFIVTYTASGHETELEADGNYSAQVLLVRMNSHSAARCGVDGEPKAGRAHLAPRRAEGTAKAALARAAMAERRVVHPSAA